MAFSYNPMQEGNASNIGFSYMLTHFLEKSCKLSPLDAFVIGQGSLFLYEYAQDNPRNDDYISNLIGYGGYKIVMKIDL